VGRNTTAARKLASRRLRNEDPEADRLRQAAAREGEFERLLALPDGDAAIVWLVGGAPRVVYRFSTDGERIAGIELIGDPDRLRALDLVISR
jgi:hypothetical protein